MDLDGLGIFSLLFYWRGVLCLVLSGIAGFVLIDWFPWFDVFQIFGFIIFGFGAGGIWEAAADRSRSSSRPAQSTSTVVAALTAFIAGGIWGALSSPSLHSALAGFIVLAIATGAWFFCAVVYRAWLSRAQGFVCTVVVSAAYATTALVVHHAMA